MKTESAIQTRHPRNEVGLAEALQACVVLGVREGPHAQWLAEALGLAWRESSGTAGQAIPPAPVSQPGGVGPSVTAALPGNKPRKLKLLEPVGHEPIAFEVLFESHADKVRNVVELRPATFTAGEERPSFQPLFLERWFQGIFTSILGTRIPSWEIDFRKLERAVIRGDALDQLPFKLRSSLVKGVHVLLDRSESMQPFWRDETELLARLRRLLGEALVLHTWFEYDALRPDESRIKWHTQMPRQFREETPVLLITDFGAGSDPLASRGIDWAPWLPILQLAESNRCRIFTLIPSSSCFWPMGLHHLVDGALLWDRETSPQTAARLCQR